MDAGWREWGALPELGIPAIKLKIDTGARTSTLHAFSVQKIRVRGRDRVRFRIHPLQRRTDIELMCEADLLDQRYVADSGGHRERRYVIRTPFKLGGEIWPIELTLTRRDTMLFRMLLGRSAMEDRVLVHPSKSYLSGPRVVRAYKLYKPIGESTRS